MVRESGVRVLLPYFFHYVATGMTQFPDGRGMLFQPKRLRTAFLIMNAVYNKATEVQRAIEKAGQNGGPKGLSKIK